MSFSDALQLMLTFSLFIVELLTLIVMIVKAINKK